MSRERALKCVLILSGLIFLAGVIPLAMSLLDGPRSNGIVPMFLSLYVTLGVFLLIAARNPAGHRSLILFAAWSSFAHAAVMLIQACSDVAGRPELFGMAALLIVIGVPLVALMPMRQRRSA